MSRFFRSAQDSDSDSDASSSSGSESFDDGPQQKQAPTGANRFARVAFDSDSDSDDDVKRVVKSPKEKYTDETVRLSAAVLKAARADEWSAVSADFDKLKAAAEKLKGVLKGESLPRIYMRCLAKVEDRTVREGMDREQLAKLSASDARAFNKLKQRMRKYTEPFAKQLAEYRANPVDSAEDDAAEAETAADEQPQGAASSSDDDDEADRAVPAPRGRPARPVPAAASGSESDGSYWGSESDEDESSSESEDEGRVGFARWLKKTPTKDEVSAKKTRKERSHRAAPAAAAAAASGDDADDGFTTVGKGGKAVQKPAVTAETLNKNLKAIRDSRGRKGTNKHEIIRQLETLLGVAANPLQRCKVLMALISAQFDSAGSSAGGSAGAAAGAPGAPAAATYMPAEQWTRAQATINDMLATLEENSQIAIFETADVHDDDSDIAYANEAITLNGSIVGFVERLDDEFTRALQHIDPHTPDYIERMRDSVPLYATIARAQCYFERCDLKDSLCRVVLRRVEHLYYRTDQVNRQVEEAAAALPGRATSTIVPAALAASPEAALQQLCSFLYQTADPVLRVRAMLMHVFNHALHKRYYVARDLLLMSHIQENAHQVDVKTQVLYNRALAQLGLAAFRLGLIQESFEHTVELISSGNQRELLAQGVSQQRTLQLSPAEEQLMRLRQLPFHININLELLECVFLTASMLIEIPYVASANTNPEARRVPISRGFRRMLDFNERQVFVGPPENTRDHIMASAKALAAGDWVASRDYIHAIKIWSLLPDCEQIKEMLARKIQIEALRTYLFTYSTQFEAVGLDDLAAMFSLPRPKVYALLARMVYHGELQASLDEVSGVLAFSRANFEAPSRLQQTALALSNKANAFADINERIFELKINGGQVPGDRQQGGFEQGGRGQGDRDGRSGYQRGGAGGGRDGRDGQRNQGYGRRDGGPGGRGGRGGHRGGGRGGRGGASGAGGGRY
ncbi:Translation initiation factor 3 subunit c [Coemansia biformis]|uniref:Eukaryotic translation initiation factor 3 subunit C n=1 Tax=Coemansia biformis TaxID=1286918 RepID=A0A9W8D120_9FUNG|nr:Translation initiation factor 3 subunit c [Coemansia biformis]